jgi:hypothetical protein
MRMYSGVIAMVIVILVGACGKKKEAEATGTGSGTGTGAVAGSAAVAGSGTAAAGSGALAGSGAAAGFLPEKLAEKKGLVIAEAKGGTVEGIPDGAVVDVVADHTAEMGGEDASTMDVAYGGKTVTIPATRVVSEAGLQRSPDNKFAVYSTIVSCGDLCHTEVYVVGTDGSRVKLGDGVVDVVVAWSKDGTTAAVGSGTLWLVDLAAGLKSTPHEDYTSPAYGPDGVLYVRDTDGSAFTGVEAGKPKRVYKTKRPKDDGDEYGANQPIPVLFDKKSGKPIFDLAWDPMGASKIED